MWDTADDEGDASIASVGKSVARPEKGKGIWREIESGSRLSKPEFNGGLRNVMSMV